MRRRRCAGRRARVPRARAKLSPGVRVRGGPGRRARPAGGVRQPGRGVPGAQGTVHRQSAQRTAAPVTVTWRAVRPVRASEEVATQILRAFYDERLKPGEWLGTEAELAERFSVSRVTIRDAVSGLAARGLLDV